jgi:hypothetical protein
MPTYPVNQRPQKGSDQRDSGDAEQNPIPWAMFQFKTGEDT